MWAKTDFNLVEPNMAHWVTASLRDQMASSVYLWVFINSDSNKWVIEAKATSQGRQGHTTGSLLHLSRTSSVKPRHKLGRRCVSLEWTL